VNGDGKWRGAETDAVSRAGGQVQRMVYETRDVDENPERVGGQRCFA
jgi:hypothetical protein